MSAACVDGKPALEGGLELWLADAAAAMGTLDLLERMHEVGVAEDLTQGDVGGAGAEVCGRAREEPVRLRVGRRGRPEAAADRVDRVERMDQARLEGGPAGRCRRATGGILGEPRL